MSTTEHVVIHSDGAIEKGWLLDDAKAERMSRMAGYAAIIDLRETANGLHVVYQDGVRRQIDVPTQTILGAAQPHRGRVGWTS